MTKQISWDKNEIDVLIEMRNSGESMKEIAKTLGRSHNSVKMYVQRHAEKLGLKPYLDFKARAKSQRPEFDREWYGPVPFGHWALTKPWRKSA